MANTDVQLSVGSSTPVVQPAVLAPTLSCLLGPAALATTIAGAMTITELVAISEAT